MRWMDGESNREKQQVERIELSVSLFALHDNITGNNTKMKKRDKFGSENKENEMEKIRFFFSRINSVDDDEEEDGKYTYKMKKNCIND